MNDSDDEPVDQKPRASMTISTAHRAHVDTPIATAKDQPEEHATEEDALRDDQARLSKRI